MNIPNGFARCSLICVSCCLVTGARGAEIKKLNNTTSLNSGGSWSGGVVPGSNDVMVWDQLVTGTSSPDIAPDDSTDPSPALPEMGANRSVAGIKVTNVGGTRHDEGKVIGFENPASANTLTVGISGIDLSAATQALFMQPRVLIGANQTWDIADANFNGRPAYFDNNEDLTFQAMAASTPFDFGGRTVTTTGAGQVTITSGYNLTNGTLDVGNNLFVIQGGTNRRTNLGSNLNLRVSSGMLRLQSNSGASGQSLVSAANIEVFGGTLQMRSGSSSDSFSFTQSGPITLHSGTTLHYVIKSDGPMTTSGPITVAGDATLSIGDGGNPPTGTVISGNILGSANLTYRNFETSNLANPPLIHLSGDNSGYSGAITIDGTASSSDLRLASSTAGSANAAWHVAGSNTLEVHGVSVQLGKLTGFGTITNSNNSSTATLNIGAGDYYGTINNGNDPTALNKISTGKLVLNGTNTYSGGTTVNAGTLILNSAVGGTMVVNAAGTLGGIGPLEGTATIHGAVSPGSSVGRLESNDPLTFAPGSDYVFEIGNWTGTAPGDDWDYLDVNAALSFTATAANKLVIQVVGPLSGFTEMTKVVEIAEGNSISGFNVANIQVDQSRAVGYGTWTVRRKPSNTLIIELVYAPDLTLSSYEAWTNEKGLALGNRDPSADADGDGHPNRLEFALDEDPLSGTSSGKVVGKIGMVDGAQALTITLPVRSAAAFTGSTDKALAVDGVTYRVQASDDLNLWNLTVSEVTGTDATNIRNSLSLPVLSSATWRYRTFRSPGPVSGDPREYLRVVVD